MFKMHCWIPNAYILDITMYKMHVWLCSYCTIRILISKTSNGKYEGGYPMYLRFYNNASQIHMRNLLHMYRLKFLEVSILTVQ